MYTYPLFGGGLGSALLRVNNMPKGQNTEILANAQNIVRLNPNNNANGGAFQLGTANGVFGSTGLGQGAAGTYKFRIITFHSEPTSTNSGTYGLQQGFISSGGGFVTGGSANLDNNLSQMLFTESVDSGAQFPNINRVVTAVIPSGGDGGTGDSFRFHGLGDVSSLTPFNFKIEILSRP